MTVPTTHPADFLALEHDELPLAPSQECAETLPLSKRHRSVISNPKGIVLHADNGGQMKGATMQITLERLGVVPSFTWPGVSDDNPYAEAMFRTLKYCLAYSSHPFPTINDAIYRMEIFAQWYNHEHRHSGIQFVTPEKRYSGREHAILAQRQTAYEHARSRRPDRWSGPTRN